MPPTLLERWLVGPSRADPVIGRVRSAVGTARRRPAARRARRRTIDHLADVYDAVADVVLAESVHQIVRGQPERAQAATAFLDRQEVPVEPEVAVTPRSSWGYVQRCVVVLGATTVSSAWQPLSAGDPRARGRTPPERWISQLLGDPAQWRFVGEAVTAAGAVKKRAVAQLDELGLSPLPSGSRSHVGGRRLADGASAAAAGPACGPV